MKRTFALFVLSCVLLGAAEVWGQGYYYPPCSNYPSYPYYPMSGPNGSIGVPNSMGTTTFYYPSALNPGANVIVPDTMRPISGGFIYRGADGLIHGQQTDPFGNVNVWGSPRR